MLKHDNWKDQIAINRKSIGDALSFGSPAFLLSQSPALIAWASIDLFLIVEHKPMYKRSINQMKNTIYLENQQQQKPYIIKWDRLYASLAPTFVSLPFSAADIS